MSTQSISKRLLGFIAIIIGSLSLAGCFHGKSHHRGGEMLTEYLSWKLDFSEEQQALLEEVRIEVKEARENLKDQREQGKAELITLINSDTLDTSAALTLFDRKHTVVRTQAPAVLEKVAALHATLTAEQKEKIIHKINSMDRHH